MTKGCANVADLVVGSCRYKILSAWVKGRQMVVVSVRTASC